MADENVKIVIQEDNLTNPIGSGVSSDVVYVPGLAVEHWHNSTNPESEVIESKKNIPVLCSTISEFESAFGPKPYQYKDTDIANCPYITEGTYVVGGYDKSYLYARELLNAGLSVLYENIAPEVGLQRVGHVSLRENDYVTDLGDCKFAFTPPVATTSSDNTLTPSSTDVEFSIALNYREPMVGTAVTVAVNVPKLKNEDDEVALSITSGTLTCDKASSTAFTVSAVEDDPSKYLISIEDASAYDFESTNFTLSLTFSYNSAAEITTEIGIDVVEGDVVDIVDDIDVNSSRIEHFYKHLLENVRVLEDKNEYSVKYITTGGYPSFIKIAQVNGKPTYSLASSLIDIAKKRGDAVALIDHPNKPEIGRAS